MPRALPSFAATFAVPRKALSTAVRKRAASGMLRWLTDLPSPMPQPQLRRERMLAWLITALLVLLGLALPLIGVTPDDPVVQARYASMIAALLVVLAVAGGLNRLGHYRIAAYVTVIAAMTGPALSLWLDPSVARGDLMPLAYGVLAVFLSAVLLPVRATIALTVLSVGSIAYALLVGHDTGLTPHLASLLGFLVATTVLTLIATQLTRRDLDETDRVARQLTQNALHHREQSVRDPLTGLFNRRFLDETLNREIERSARRGATLGLIVLDIDHFKTLNDTCGHAAGDTVLRTLGGYLQKHLRSEDIACRYGGDEFLLVLPETPPETVLALAEDICSGARALKPRPTGRAFPTVSLSVGVATYPKHGMTAESLVLSADQALYAAKRGGRNRVCSAGESAA